MPANNLALIKNSVFPFLKGCFELPKIKGKKTFYIVPLSGGIDSFATAYTLLALFPDAPFIFVHADTGVEVPGTREAMIAFKEITGKKIVFLVPKKDLCTQIEDSGNFIPSQLQRSCTQLMKTKPIKHFYQMLKEKFGDDAVFINFVGIRADEPTRTGIVWTEKHIASVHPLAELGLVKSDVNNIVNEIQTIPSYYEDKSRSGCAICIFSRRQEIIAQWKRDAIITTRFADMEEIPDNVLSIYNALPRSVAEQVGASRNWLAFYRPSWLNNPETGYEGKRGKKVTLNNAPTFDMFAAQSKKLFVAIEYNYYPNLYGATAECFVFGEKVITYSTSLNGLGKSLKHFWLHRLHTKEMHHENTEETIGAWRRIAIVEMEIDNFDEEIPPKPEDVFTWQNDRTPLYAIRKTTAVIEHVMLCEGIRQSTEHTNKQVREASIEQTQRLRGIKEYGRILNASEYTVPSLEDLTDDIDIAEAPQACHACSR